jgi:hypothetical protein
MALTREQILKPRPRVTEVIACPELGDDANVIVRRLTASEFVELNEKAREHPEKAYVYWLVASVIDDAGNPLFSEDDAVALGEQDVLLVQRLTEAAQRLSVVTKEQAKND